MFKCTSSLGKPAGTLVSGKTFECFHLVGEPASFLKKIVSIELEGGCWKHTLSNGAAINYVLRLHVAKEDEIKDINNVMELLGLE